MFSDQIKQLSGRTLGRFNPKQKQWMVLIGIGLGFFIIMWAMFAIGDKSPPPPPPSDPLGIVAAKTPPSPILAGGQTVRPADVWISKAGQELDQLKRDRDESRAKSEKQDKAAKEMLARFEELQKKLAQPQPVPPAPAPVIEEKKVAATTPVQPARSSLPPLPPPPRPGAGSGSIGLPFGEPEPGYAAQPSASLVRVSLGDAKPFMTPAQAAAAGVPGVAGDAPAKTPPRTLDNFLPISFTKAVLLGGLDAPTGGQSQSNPHPVLLRLEDNAVLPNKFRGQVRECFVVGAGYGDLSSERAYIRTEKLSCMRNDGTVIEINIKGSIFGEDGKVGVRGRLVSKQGQVLANALVAGVISGIGSGVQASFTNTNTTALGSVQTTDPNHAFQAGLGGGFSKAMDRMAQYYITLAEKMFPIIEVDAGRLVDVVLTEGAVLEAPLVTGPDGQGRTGNTSYYSQRAQQRPIGANNDD
ncbi:MAG: TraB/VirB10 family protein [Rhizobacter sp.]